jgi:hypothetical protein
MVHAIMPWPIALDWLKRCACIALALLSAILARLAWNNVRRNVLLRRQLDGPRGSLLLGTKRMKLNSTLCVLMLYRSCGCHGPTAMTCPASGTAMSRIRLSQYKA